MGVNVLSQIIDNVKNAGMYSVIMDETQDLKKHEQVSIDLRYCDKRLNVIENFIGFYKTDKLDGETLSNLLKSTLQSLDLKIENMRGQCYDGAASMRGSYSGVAKRIRDENKLALYVHCYAHILNLCVVDVCGKVAPIRNMFGEVSILKLRISSIEQSNLNNYIDITGIPQTKNENCSEIVKQIGLKTNTIINVIEANRIYITNDKNSIIVAKLETNEMKKKFIRNSKISKLSPNIIHNEWSNEIKVYINERLKKDRRIIFGQARAAGREKKFKFVWVNNGDILLKKEESSKTIRIRTPQDLEKM
ncbi:zinc finger MYM-type protein 1-like [Acyrthosiphon pisum]|uniref:Zinc finger MYM-type protein 1-like n=1 Tax=Acyrthosiphon pisum TaxID=7029 RepID=A0A8R2F978_ACYPI|nr:zinc finger MYM-type protein 1-like [Acyrthosiphon pisum]|eukprot:XP_008183717.1 PREDICTED: zinc finger MYM-type protein 1-like [Acyrthosiphon pisum]